MTEAERKIDAAIDEADQVASAGCAAPAGSPPPPDIVTKPMDPHVRHHIYLDRWKFRGVYVTAPAQVTRAEMDRIKGWLETLFIIEEDNQLR